MPVADFPLHAYGLPVTAPAAFVEFLTRQLGRPCKDFACAHAGPESYLAGSGRSS